MKATVYAPLPRTNALCCGGREERIQLPAANVCVNAHAHVCASTKKRAKRNGGTSHRNLRGCIPA